MPADRCMFLLFAAGSYPPAGKQVLKHRAETLLHYLQHLSKVTKCFSLEKEQILRGWVCGYKDWASVLSTVG